MSEMTVLGILEKTKIPAIYQNNLEEYPHVEEFFRMLKKGKCEQALSFYEFFINRKEFYLDKKGIVNARTKRGNRRNRKNYGSNYYKKLKQYIRPSLYKKQNGLCKSCFNWFSEKEFEVDHIKKVTEGGEREDLNNLQLLCIPCHDKKDNYIKGCEKGFLTGKMGTPWIVKS